MHLVDLSQSSLLINLTLPLHFTGFLFPPFFTYLLDKWRVSPVELALFCLLLTIFVKSFYMLLYLLYFVYTDNKNVEADLVSGSFGWGDVRILLSRCLCVLQSGGIGVLLSFFFLMSVAINNRSHDPILYYGLRKVWLLILSCPYIF